MSRGLIFTLPMARPLDSVGQIMPGAKAYFYLAGTLTAADVYTDQAMTTPHPQPVEANAQGRFPAIYLDPQVNYKVDVQSSVGLSLPGYPVDGVGDIELSASAIGAAFYPVSEAESAASAVVLNFAFPHGRIERYGATVASANNSVAIQAAFNQASYGGANPSAGPGRFRFTSAIYTYYDAANNPNWNNADGTYDQGQVVFRGDGYVDYQAWSLGIVRGTMLDYTAATGSPWRCGNSTNGTHRSIRFENVTLVTSDTSHNDYVIRFIGTSQGSGAFQTRIFQAGLGGGILMKDCWASFLEDVRARTGNPSNTGTGIYCTNPNNGAGNSPVIEKCSFVGFRRGGQIGDESAAASSIQSFDTVRISHTQFAGRNDNMVDGLVLGEQIYACILENLYMENVTGSLMRVQSQIESLQVIGGFWRPNDCTANAIILGKSGGTNYENYIGSCILQGLRGQNLPAGIAYIERNVGTQTGGLKITGGSFSADSATGTAVLVINGDGKGVSWDGVNSFSGTAFANEYTYTGDADLDYYRSGRRTDGSMGRTKVKGVWIGEEVTYTYSASPQDVDVSYPVVKVNGAGGAFTLHMQDGKYPGHRVAVKCINATGTVSLNFTTDSAKDGSIGTTGQQFNSVDDNAVFEWLDSEWAMVSNSGTVGY